MPLSFHKMHGAGNDFVLVDARGQQFELSPHRAGLIADRRRGVGCDQILVLREAADAANLLSYEIRNSDGSTAGQCGNGARCIAHYLYTNGEAGDTPFAVESPSGVVVMRHCTDGEYEVEMGVPEFSPGLIPVKLEGRDGRYRLQSPWGALEFGAVSMGNPHALVTVPDIHDSHISEMGDFLGSHEIFPDGCNAGFAMLDGPGRIHLRVIERGAGETLACGSGACAAMAILHRAGQVGDSVEVLLPGGTLVIKWRGHNETLTMKGPAVHVYRGIMHE